VYVLKAWLLQKAISTVFYIGMHTFPTFNLQILNFTPNFLKYCIKTNSNAVKSLSGLHTTKGHSFPVHTGKKLIKWGRGSSNIDK